MIRNYDVYTMTKWESIVFYICGYTAIFILCFLFYRSVVLAMLLGGAVYFLKSYVEGYYAAKRKNLLHIQFKDMLYSLSASIAAGRQMEEAILEAEDNLSIMYGSETPLMRELHFMKISITENKETDKNLLMDFAHRSKSEDISNFVQVYITCRNMGGDLEKVIGHATEILTDKMTIDKEIKTLTSQKKTEGRIISSMPIVMLTFMNVFSYSYIEPLYTTITGRMLMTGALIAMIYGVYLMEKLSEVEM